MMFVPSDMAYEEIRRRQRELHEQAALGQLVARARREAAQAGPKRPRRSWFARRPRTDLARP